MSIQVTDFKWEKGKNDLKYIELLEKTLKNEQAITAKAVAKIRKLSDENKEIRAKAIDDFAEALVKHTHKIPSRCLGGANVLEIAEQMKAGADNE